MATIDTVVAFGAGATLGAHLARWIAKADPQTRSSWYIDLAALLILAYLVTVSTCGA
jgi:hypothetical protein